LITNNSPSSDLFCPFKVFLDLENFLNVSIAAPTPVAYIPELRLCKLKALYGKFNAGASNFE